MRFYNALTFSGWTSSTEFTLEEIFCNTMDAYYLTLINTMLEFDDHGPSKMWSYCLPKVTTRNTLRCLGHLLTRIIGWPKHQNFTFEPKFTQEDSIEFFFGRIKTGKRGVHGSATTSNSIQSTQLLHLQEAKSVREATDGCGSWVWTGCQEDAGREYNGIYFWLSLYSLKTKKIKRGFFQQQLLRTPAACLLP